MARGEGRRVPVHEHVDAARVELALPERALQEGPFVLLNAEGEDLHGTHSRDRGLISGDTSYVTRTLRVMSWRGIPVDLPVRPGIRGPSPGEMQPE
ncbi:hypothetical protein GCM10009801_35480 [Streptomyces albiaxialis]|uniref:Uncharacterized protein n=1 Tax=Streptomyces albiaxialis TaxID=329523 RepID=A0ABN2VZN4_9ACTN